MITLPPLNRRKVLEYLQNVKRVHIAGTRGKFQEAYCKGQFDAAATLIAEIVTGRMEDDVND